MASIEDNKGLPSSDRKGFKRLLPLRKDSALPKPDDRKPPVPSPTRRKKGFSLAFCRLGCASPSSSQADSPAAAATARPSGERQGRKDKQKRKEEERRSQDEADAWCAPGFVFADEADWVFESRHPMMGRGRLGAERIHRERPCISRWGSREEQMPAFMGSPPPPGTPLFVSGLLSSGHFRRFHGYSDGFEEVMMPTLLLGGMDVCDRFKDWRLDVDNMSYEELLELGDRIGYVSTGLEEGEIFRRLRKMKHSMLDVSTLHFSTEKECKCSICQEEYEVNDEIGKLECGHSYHINCIKEWLLQKNACPICKIAVTQT